MNISNTDKRKFAKNASGKCVYTILNFKNIEVLETCLMYYMKHSNTLY